MMKEKELKEGEQAPDFSLPSSEGRNISLKDFKGKKSVVLYFYPKDDTPGCTKEACGFRDMIRQFEAKDSMILGVSLDDESSHKKFIQKYSLPFTLLSDVDHQMSTAYGVYKEKNMYGKTYWGIERTTFVIDKAGRIAKIFPKVKVDNHISEVLDFIKTLG
ncbi:MAG: thioredoxin-dependent thiol peroxidase [Nitrospira sp.]|nr:thioredoxin-dependent thiol peroxidase [Nitrospira sp.]